MCIPGMGAMTGWGVRALETGLGVPRPADARLQPASGAGSCLRARGRARRERGVGANLHPDLGVRALRAPPSRGRASFSCDGQGVLPPGED